MIRLRRPFALVAVKPLVRSSRKRDALARKTEQTGIMSPLPLRAWLEPGRKLTGHVKRFYVSLPWAWRISALGIVLIVTLIAIPRFVPVVWRPPIRAAGFVIFFGTTLATGLPRIKNISDRPTKIGLYAAWGSIVAGAILAVPAMVVTTVPHWAHVTGTIGAILFLLAAPIFGVVSVLAGAITVAGLGTVITILAILAISIFIFPPAIIYLMTNGQWPKPYILGPPQTNSGWADAISIIPLAALFVAPEIFRKILPWDKAEKATRRHLPNWLTGIALVSTCGYALALQAASAPPLATFPLTGLILAFLFVGLVLWPFYKLIIISSWRLGIAKAIQLSSWRDDQQKMFHEVRTALRQIWNVQTKPEKHQAKPGRSNHGGGNTGPRQENWPHFRR